MTELTLSVIGSRGLAVKVTPAALPEAGPGGVAVELSLHDGPLVVTMTEGEALNLAVALAMAAMRAVWQPELAERQGR